MIVTAARKDVVVVDVGSSVQRWSVLEPRGTTPEAERIDELLSNGAVRIERIESHGHRAPSDPTGWFDQDEDEWVIVLTGAGRLQIEGVAEAIELRAGDAVRLPAHTRHQVAWTDPEQPTVWIAVFSRPHPER